MPIDNFDKITKLLEYPNDDIFYSVQIIQRKKDILDPNIRLGKNNNSRTIKSYYVTSNEMLLDLKEEMVQIANLFEARICINLNPKSFKKVAHENNILIANLLRADNFKHVKNTYDKSVAKGNIKKSKYLIIDIDEEDMSSLDEISNLLRDLYSTAKKYKSSLENDIVAFLPSKSGMHIIANPFNKIEFKKKYPSIEIKTNSPTNLYIL